MSAISVYLERLRSALFGEDVRGAIIGAITECYDNVNDPTLRTDALETALQHKIDQGEMAALTIGDHTITAAKLAQGVIPTPDTTLSQSGVPADAKTAGDEIAALQADLVAMEGLTNDIKEALIACFDNVAWANERGDASYESLKNALGIVYKYDLSLSNGLVEKHVGGIGSNSNHSMCLDNGVNRRTYTYSEGVIPFFDKETDTPLNVYPIPVPPDAVSVTITITPNTQYIFAAIRKLTSDRTDYSSTIGSIPYTAGSGTINIVRDDERKYLFILSKYNNAGSSYPTEPTDLRIVFHKEGA